MEKCFRIIDNELTNCLTGEVLKNPSVIMMKDCGSPLYFGNHEVLSDYMLSLCANRDFYDSDNYELINFVISSPQSKIATKGQTYTKEEICALFNYLQQVTIDGDTWTNIKNLEYKELKKWLTTLIEQDF